jgi:flavin-dependent thymidylate synthase
MVELKFHMAMPIFVARQMVRHRTASLNEYSARYSVMPMLFYVPDYSVVGKQSVNNKQGRGQALDEEQFDQYLESLERAHAAAQAEYEKQVAMGVARETARGVLPVSTYTQWYWKIDLRNMLHFLGLRCDPHAQLEIRVFANVMAGMVKRIAPETFEAWIDYEFCGAQLSRMEVQALRKLLTFVGNPDGSPAEIRSLVFNDPRESSPRPAGVSVGALTTEYGMSKREVVEFFERLTPKPIPSFDLDLSQARAPEFFAEKWAAAVPRGDRSVG